MAFDLAGMVLTPRLTAIEDITMEQMREELAWVAELLESEGIVVEHYTDLRDDDVQLPIAEKRPGFNMQTVIATRKDGCGTAACIGGHVLYNLGHRLEVPTEQLSNLCYRLDGSTYDNPRGLYGLFYPCYDFEAITTEPAKAAEAIRDYLHYGSVDWEDIMEA